MLKAKVHVSSDGWLSVVGYDLPHGSRLASKLEAKYTALPCMRNARVRNILGSLDEGTADLLVLALAIVRGPPLDQVQVTRHLLVELLQDLGVVLEPPLVLIEFVLHTL